MANYRQVSYGSQGSDVAELQKLLNSKGNYNLATDGIFGEKTQAAVKDYQSKNGLDVDGIAGNYTWGSLTGGSQQSGSTATSSNSGFQISDKTAAADQNRQAVAANKPGEFSYGAYEKSDAVKQAEALLQQQLASKPGPYQSAWQSQLDDTLNQILNREDFSYNLNEDALYKQLTDQYVTQGQQAMMDTMGQAAAMTGGYGNSYAQTAGQQTYQGYMKQLNDKVPELYQLALDQYNREGDELYTQYGMYADRDSQDYGRYRDTVSDYNNELGRLTEDARYQDEQDYGRYLDAYNMAYGEHRDSVADWQNEQARADEDYWNQYSRDYGTYRDNVADQQWQAQFDEANNQWAKEFALAEDQWNTEKNKVVSAIRETISNDSSGLLKPIQGSPTDKTGDPVPEPTGTTGSVPDSIVQKVSGYTNNTDLATYLDGLTSSGTITEEQADQLFAEYKQVEQAGLSNRNWSLVDDGGVNWLWGIDNNATVKDQYGNTYRLDKLVDALVAEGMSKDAAKTYVKNLQAKLGA